MASLLLVSPALAHPHMWIDASVQMHVDDQGRLTKITQSWQFDDLFSSYAIQGLPLDSQRRPLQTDLDAIAADWIEALGDPMSHYFTDIEQGNRSLSTHPAENVQSSWSTDQGRLTLTFDLVLRDPASRADTVSVRVADPTFFVAYEFDPDQISSGSELPQACKTQYIPPRELDPETANRLASIPASQAEPPPELLAITRTLEHRIELSCEP